MATLVTYFKNWKSLCSQFYESAQVARRTIYGPWWHMVHQKWHSPRSCSPRESYQMTHVQWQQWSLPIPSYSELTYSSRQQNLQSHKFVQINNTRGIQYFLSLVLFCGLMYNLDLFYLGIINYTFYLSKDKILYRYDHLFAHLMSLHNLTLIHCGFNMSWKQDKSPGNSEGIC